MEEGRGRGWGDRKREEEGRERGRDGGRERGREGGREDEGRDIRAGQKRQ